MKSLLRTEAAGFSTDDCFTLEDIERGITDQDPSAFIIPVEKVFAELPGVNITSDSEGFLKNGNKLYAHNFTEPVSDYDEVRVCSSRGVFKAVYEKDDDHFKVKYMF